jgi:hypothetical protein
MHAMQRAKFGPVSKHATNLVGRATLPAAENMSGDRQGSVGERGAIT